MMPAWRLSILDDLCGEKNRPLVSSWPGVFISTLCPRNKEGPSLALPTLSVLSLVRHE